MAKSIIEKHIRQIEILGLSLGIPISKSNLELAFNVSVDTIKSDLSELNKQGLSIHSTKKGIIVDNNVLQYLPEKIDYYFRLRKFRFINNAAISNLVDSLGINSLYFLVAIYKQIEHSRSLTFSYKNNNFIINEAKPLSLWYANGDYRLLCQTDSLIKQYSLRNILSINFKQQLNNSIKNTNLLGYLEICNIKDNNLDNDFVKYSFGGWVSNKVFEVVLSVNHNYNKQILLQDQETLSADNSNQLIRGKVNSIVELAKYISSQSGRIVAIEPPELISYIRNNVKKVLFAHKNSILK